MHLHVYVWRAMSYSYILNVPLSTSDVIHLYETSERPTCQYLLIKFSYSGFFRNRKSKLHICLHTCMHSWLWIGHKNRIYPHIFTNVCIMYKLHAFIIFLVGCFYAYDRKNIPSGCTAMLVGTVSKSNKEPV